jgi:hypothetical protein
MPKTRASSEDRSRIVMFGSTVTVEVVCRVNRERGAGHPPPRCPIEHFH